MARERAVAAEKVAMILEVLAPNADGSAGPPGLVGGVAEVPTVGSAAGTQEAAAADPLDALYLQVQQLQESLQCRTVEVAGGLGLSGVHGQAGGQQFTFHCERALPQAPYTCATPYTRVCTRQLAAVP